MHIHTYVDHTLLKPTATKKDIEILCDEAIANKFYAVCVNSSNVPAAKEFLFKSDVKICATVGFPFGASSTASKIAEATKAIEEGADEIDMVINLGKLKSRNYVAVYKDIRDVKLAIGHKPLKVIIEISELSKNEILKMCQICIDAKADYIKTSTGFSKSGATLTAVKIIKKTVREKIKIKASGGIRDLDAAIKYIEAGADRIGTSSGVRIVEELSSDLLEV